MLFLRQGSCLFSFYGFRRAVATGWGDTSDSIPGRGGAAGEGPGALSALILALQSPVCEKREGNKAQGKWRETHYSRRDVVL
jgi:hypothetical protein